MPTTYRKDPLVIGEIYHVMNKSIAGFKIFHGQQDYLRMKRMIQYFQVREKLPKFSQFFELKPVQDQGFESAFHELAQDSRRYVQLISYCLMPTHLHIVAKQLTRDGISLFMANLLNSYARFFNTKYQRSGPLWVGRFKSVLVKTDEQLLHLTRYLHLNPTTAELAQAPEDWLWSSYQEYVAPKDVDYPLCLFDSLLNITSKQYQKFTDDHIDYQRSLAKIKKLVLE